MDSIEWHVTQSAPFVAIWSENYISCAAMLLNYIDLNRTAPISEMNKNYLKNHSGEKWPAAVDWIAPEVKKRFFY